MPETWPGRSSQVLRPLSYFFKALRQPVALFLLLSLNWGSKVCRISNGTTYMLAQINSSTNDVGSLKAKASLSGTKLMS